MSGKGYVSEIMTSSRIVSHGKVAQLPFKFSNSFNPFSIFIVPKTNGTALRLVYVGSGTPTNYVGNDGKIYRIVKIGTQYWLADNLAETKYRDGSTIPEVTDNTAWSNLTTGARCVYNNDESNM